VLLSLQAVINNEQNANKKTRVKEAFIAIAWLIEDGLSVPESIDKFSHILCHRVEW
jgi:hypothetical protein